MVAGALDGVATTADTIAGAAALTAAAAKKDLLDILILLLD